MFTAFLKKIFFLLSMAVLFSSCATLDNNDKTVKERYFWPPLPDEPKIEWIGAYNSHLDLGNKTSKLLTFLIGEETAEGLLFPFAIASDGAGKVYVTDIGKFNVTVFDFTLRDTHILGAGAAETLLEKPSGIDLDESGNIYVGDMNKMKIVVFNKDEKPLKVLELAGVVKSVASFRIDKQRKRIVIPDTKGHQIVIVDYDGNPIKTIVLFKNSDGSMDGFRFPNALDIDSQGNIIVADTVNARVVRLTPDGDFISTIGIRGDTVGTVDFVKGVAVDSDGHIYMTDFRANRLQVFNDKGQTLMAIGDKGLKDNIGSFNTPSNIYIDKNDTIYVSETIAHRFQILQYITKDYLARNPISDATPAAKPLVNTPNGGLTK